MTILQVELLAKKYEEKYKQTGDVASKLTIEEATFRDIQVFLWLFLTQFTDVLASSILYNSAEPFVGEKNGAL